MTMRKNKTRPQPRYDQTMDKPCNRKTNVRKMLKMLIEEEKNKSSTAREVNFLFPIRDSALLKERRQYVL